MEAPHPAQARHRSRFIRESKMSGMEPIIAASLISGGAGVGKSLIDSGQPRTLGGAGGALGGGLASGILSGMGDLGLPMVTSALARDLMGDKNKDAEVKTPGLESMDLSSRDMYAGSPYASNAPTNTGAAKGAGGDIPPELLRLLLEKGLF